MLTPEEQKIVDTAQVALAEFFELVPLGSCNMPWLFAKNHPQYVDKKLPSWSTAGKDYSAEHCKLWCEKFIDMPDRLNFFNRLTWVDCKMAYDHIASFKTGNCGTLALGYVWYLIDKLERLGLDRYAMRIEVLRCFGIDHTFVVLNRPNTLGTLYSNSLPSDCIFIDPWLRLFSTGDKWLDLIGPCGELLGWEKALKYPITFWTVYSNHV